MKDLLSNLPPFYIGQKVIYITGNNMPKNSIHIVSDIWLSECGECWTVLINNEKKEKIKVGKEYTKLICVSCKKTFPVRDYYGGWCHTSFRAIQQQNFPLIKFQQIEIYEGLKHLKEGKQILIEN